MDRLAPPGGVVFDCDGVLIDSNGVKAAAFRAALAGEPEQRIADFFVDFHTWPGQSRFELFTRYIRDKAGRADWQERVAKTSEAFAVTMQKVLTACNPLPGIDRFLDWLASRNIPCAVVSALGVQRMQVAPFDALGAGSRISVDGPPASFFLKPGKIGDVDVFGRALAQLCGQVWRQPIRLSTTPASPGVWGLRPRRTRSPGERGRARSGVAAKPG